MGIAFLAKKRILPLMKELLDALDERVTGLLGALDSLRRENAVLREKIAKATAPLEQELRVLKENAARNEEAKEAAVRRIDALLLRINEHRTE